MPVLHTARGAIVYALDFKLDDMPALKPAPEPVRVSRVARRSP